MLGGCNSVFRDAPYDKLSEDKIWGDAMLLDEYTGIWYRTMDNGFYTIVSTLVKNLGQEYDPWYGDQITVGRRDWYQSGFGEILKGSKVRIIARSNLVWTAAYENIRSVNKLIENSAKLPASVLDRVVGEAYFFRAWNYYNLLRRYGGAFIIDHTFDPLVNPERFPLASYEEMVNFIAADAQIAAELLPVEHESRHTGRITRGAALMLKGKVYFWAAGPHYQNSEKPYRGFPNDRSAEMRAEAEKAYDQVIALNKYKLLDIPATTTHEIVKGYRNIFLTKNSQESILEVQHSDNGDFIYGFGHKLDRDAAPPSMGGVNSAYNPTQNHVDEYRMANGKMIDDADSGYDDQDPYSNRDVRFYANILYDGAQWGGKTLDIRYHLDENGKEVEGMDLTPYGTSTTASVTRTGYYMAKFLRESQSINTDETYGSSQNCILWRYAELLLDYAELDWYAGRKDAALAKVNMIRTRVHMPALTSISLDDILNERRVELAFEKCTYWDLLRLGIAEETMCGSENRTYKVKIVDRGEGNLRFTYPVVNGNNNSIRYFDAMQYFWPIPVNELRYQGLQDLEDPHWKQ